MRLEREKAILLEKIKNFDGKTKEAISKHIDQIKQYEKKVQELNESESQNQLFLKNEIEKYKKLYFEVENTLSETSSNYDRDKTLWEGKYTFLEQ